MAGAWFNVAGVGAIYSHACLFPSQRPCSADIGYHKFLHEEGEPLVQAVLMGVQVLAQPQQALQHHFQVDESFHVPWHDLVGRMSHQRDVNSRTFSEHLKNRYS